MLLQLALLFSVSLLPGRALQDTRLTVIDIQPCTGSTRTVSRDESIVYTIYANFSNCPNFTYNSSYALRVSTHTSEAQPDSPVVFVTRQGKGVKSWTIPVQPPDFSVLFNQVNRTLCKQNASIDEREVLGYVDVFTSSKHNVTYSLYTQPAANYFLSESTWYAIVVGASTPQVSMFRFPNSDSVTVQAEAASSRCAILSVQNVTCPTNDLLRDIRSKGVYQTMSTDGFLTITRKSVNNDELLIVLITTNFSECHGSGYVPQTPLVVNGTALGFEQTIRVIVRPLEAAPVFPIVAPLIVYLLFYVVGILIMMECFLKCQWSPFCKWRWVKSDDVNLESEDEHQEEEETALSHDTPATYGTTAVNSGGRSDLGEEPRRRSPTDSLGLSIMNEDERDLKLPRMCKTDYATLQSNYVVYSWNTVTVGIFYALPAFQLVFSEQLITNNSGNQDVCYYNFKCAHPLGVLSAFNNVWSNIGYFFLGILFIIITASREAKYKFQRKRNREYYDSHGIPQFYGIYYAMGIALILEGFMSSLYHICPTNANFQFDTAFMFVIGGLLLVKLFQNRHPDMHTNAFIAFFSFAVVIFFTLLGIYFDTSNPVAVRVSLLIIVLIMVAGFFVSFYYFHNWKFSSPMLRKIWKGIKFYFTTKPNKWTLLHRVRFLKLVAAFVINCIVALLAILAYKVLDIATAILIFFVVNVVYFLSAYVITKWFYREPWTILPMVLPFVIIGLWIAAFYFFLSNVTNWRLTPAESRALNEPCILLGFYDNHDIWHFLSSWAMFCSFLFIMTLDDGLTHVKRSSIQVF